MSTSWSLTTRSTNTARDLAAELGVELLERPDVGTLRTLISSCDLVSPAPGVPETHDVVTTAQALGVELVSEIELAYRWEQERPGGPRPMLAVTGTDGKTTTTLLAAEMLRAAGLRTVDAGNTSTPLVDAIEQDLDAFVVECTSFRLAWTPTFRAEAAVWLNLAPDHLNWHRSMDTYEAAKAQVWANQRPDDVAIGFVDDQVVMARLGSAPGRQVTFGAHDADYRVDDDALVGPNGVIARVGAMKRSLPHDITNALAASALVSETGLADTDAIAGGAGIVQRPGPPARTPRYLGRRLVVQRLESDDPARSERCDPFVRRTDPDRRRLRQGRRPRSDGSRDRRGGRRRRRR